MILRPRAISLFVSFLLYISISTAWPWPPTLRDIQGLLLRRQDGSSDSEGGAAATTQAGPSPTASPAAGSSNSAAAATSGGSQASGSATTTASESQDTDIDPRLPQGGVNLITPSAVATSTFYKIGVDSVSFAWNYTSLSITPANIDILVTCAANQATYTLASNTSFESTGSVVWDTRPDETGTAPLLTETYTLIIHDAARAVSEVAGAGQLGTYRQYAFGMYLPQKYTSLADGWQCATCNAALSDTERQAMKFMLGMCGITVLSFTWFVSGIL